MNKKNFYKLYAMLCLTFTAAPASANMGVPMIFFTLPCMFLALVPIIAIETFIIAKKLGSSEFKPFLKTVSVSNVMSTIIGVPVTWLLLLIVQIVTGGGTSYGITTPMQKILAVTWQAPWLVPYEKHFDWMIPCASIVLMIPFFFASFWIEYLISKKILEARYEATSIKKGVLIANLASYSLLIGFFIIMLIVKP